MTCVFALSISFWTQIIFISQYNILNNKHKYNNKMVFLACRVDFLLFMSYNVAQIEEIFIMATNAVVRARIDKHTKEEATVVLAAMGLTISDAFRILLIRVAKEKALPFEPLVPNVETIEAMRAARRGELTTVDNINNLLESLNTEDANEDEND